ncbi:universal stress protein [Streptomyces parvus]|uniref:universal stress protein n=1 Tax=Streptomyces parvus TaxID=66428 RepID=UPI003D71D03A
MEDTPLVVGVDGSVSSLRAVDWAANEATRHGASLRIVHASLWERYEGSDPAIGAEGPPDQALAERVVATAAARARRREPSLSVITHIAAEDPAGTLLHESTFASAVVVGSRGRGELSALLLGSVSLLVAARAACPVVVIRGDEAALNAEHGRILLGVGSRDSGTAAVHFALREASVRHATLRAVSAWRHPGPRLGKHRPPSGGAREPAEQAATSLLARALEEQTPLFPDVRVERVTAEGPAAKVLTSLSFEADLLILGARRQGTPVGLELGTTAHRALHHSACPVVVVPHAVHTTRATG